MTNSKTAKIDFAKYRSPELFQSILDLIDVRGIYVNGALKIILGTLGLLVIGGLLFWNRTHSLASFIPVLLLCMFLGGFAAAFFAIAELIRKSLDNMLKIVDLLLDVTKTITRDVSEIRDGDTEMPGAREMVNGVYTEVMLPFVEQALADKLGCLGSPILHLYRLTLGRVVKLLIKLMPDKALGFKEGNSVEPAGKGIGDQLQSVASNEERILETLDWTKKKVKTLGGRFRLLVMLPCYGLAALILLVVVLILVGLWYSLGAIAPPAA